MPTLTSLLMEISDLQSREIQSLRIQKLVMEEALLLQNQIVEKKKQLADLEQDQERFSRSVQDESGMSGELE